MSQITELADVTMRRLKPGTRTITNEDIGLVGRRSRAGLEPLEDDPREYGRAAMVNSAYTPGPAAQGRPAADAALLEARASVDANPVNTSFLGVEDYLAQLEALKSPKDNRTGYRKFTEGVSNVGTGLIGAALPTALYGGGPIAGGMLAAGGVAGLPDYLRRWMNPEADETTPGWGESALEALSVLPAVKGARTAIKAGKEVQAVGRAGAVTAGRPIGASQYGGRSSAAAAGSDMGAVTNPNQVLTQARGVARENRAWGDEGVDEALKSYTKSKGAGGKESYKALSDLNKSGQRIDEPLQQRPEMFESIYGPNTAPTDAAGEAIGLGSVPPGALSQMKEAFSQNDLLDDFVTSKRGLLDQNSQALKDAAYARAFQPDGVAFRQAKRPRGGSF